MTRDECASAWAKLLDSRRAPTVTVTRKQHAALGQLQPRFRAADGTVVQAISLSGRPVYKVTRYGYFVAFARDMDDLVLYVDIATLRMEVRI